MQNGHFGGVASFLCIPKDQHQNSFLRKETNPDLVQKELVNEKGQYPDPHIFKD